MTTRLIIARHGNTFDAGDVIRRVGLRTDLPLSSSGIAQAKKLGLYLRMYALLPDLVYTSELQRTRQTAGIALQESGNTTDVAAEAQFNEIDYGVDEDQPETAVIARLGEATLAAWERDATVPEGWLVDPAGLRQMWQDFAARVMTEQAGKTVLVVTSNGIARCALGLCPAAAVSSGRLATGALAVLTNDGQGWALKDWNLRP